MDSTHDIITVPVRIRGKRGARPEEKWNFGKRRDPKLQQRRPNTTMYGRQVAPTAPSEEGLLTSTSRPRKRRRRLVPQSPLEALPPEVLQTIFACSANIMLPLTSTQLASKLCKSMHLRYRLSDCLLYPVLGCATRASDGDLASATRLLNSRFMDLAFFKTWLCSRFQSKIPISEDPSPHDVDCKALWLACEPSPGLLPPRKLFSLPFSNDKTALLSILAQNMDNIAFANSSYGELAHEAFVDAVRLGCHAELVSVLIGLGVTVTTEILRVAVIDSACDQHVVELLIRSRSHELDLLDPMIWSWAEKAHEKGKWLMDLLRESQEELRP